jgi:hypothetical protein
MNRTACRALLAAILAAAVLPTATARAWSHQGHILITRLAALRIINDPAAPQGLRDFLKANMKYDLESARVMAVSGEDLGPEGKNYVFGLDGACTLPDRIISTAEGKKKIEPYGQPESKMHFTDMEWLSKEPIFKKDLSNKPDLAAIPKNPKDPRWQEAGFVPFRVEECYNNLVTEFKKSGPDFKNDDALHWTGYLAHYLEDAHQPLHATIDYKALTYLDGKIPSVHAVHTKLSTGGESVSFRVDRNANVNPHGDIEFELFVNTNEPRKTLREEFWKELTTRIDDKAKDAAHQPVPIATLAAPYDGYTLALHILSDSYDYIPAIGKAAEAGYSTGEFNPQTFFTSTDTVHGRNLDTIQLIADRNASAVLQVEAALRHAWADAHP